MACRRKRYLPDRIRVSSQPGSVKLAGRSSFRRTRKSPNPDIIPAVQPVYVSGHRNPDLDSIASALGYAELKSQLDEQTEYLPIRLGDVNPQTRWALERAGVEAPMYLSHIRLRARDAMQTEFPCVKESDPIRTAGSAIVYDGYDLVPVVDGRGVLAGVITTRALATSYVRRSQSTRHTDPSSLAQPDMLDAPCSELMQNGEMVTGPDDLLSEVAEQIKGSPVGAAIVTDDDGRPVGLLTRSDLVSPHRRRIILVDHAERAQAVPGIDQAEIVEILDHHHIGSIETKVPVQAYFNPVGSTATLVVEGFRHHAVVPTRSTALLLLAAVLSDTVILNSPTTTSSDEGAVAYLEHLLELDASEFGREMFEASSDVSEVSAEDLVRRDAKGYKSGNGTPFLVAQIEVVGKGLLERKDELLEAMRHERNAQGVDLYALMVTDILDRDTELLVAGDVTAAARALGVKPHNGGSLFLPGVMSRKKQVAPKLLASL